MQGPLLSECSCPWQGKEVHSQGWRAGLRPGAPPESVPRGLGPVAVGDLCQSLADTVAHDLSSLASSVK